ncbi:MAG: hypothetical protein GY943_38330 [Chloroflexi bacterium]|nr:hypothetical protein [Chloroflexota bacterium]
MGVEAGVVMGRVVKVHVSMAGEVAVQMAIGERPLSDAQMRQLGKVILRQDEKVRGRQVLVELKTWQIKIVLRRDEV